MTETAQNPLEATDTEAALAYAALHVLTRSMRLSERASTMTIYIQLPFLFLAGAFGLMFGDGSALPQGASGTLEFFLGQWVWPPSGHVMPFVALGGFSAIGGYLISQAYRATEAAVIAPFEYVALILSVLWGALIWAEVPAAATWTGIFLILGSGLFVALRETQIGHDQSTKRLAGHF